MTYFLVERLYPDQDMWITDDSVFKTYESAKLHINMISQFILKDTLYRIIFVAPYASYDYVPPMRGIDMEPLEENIDETVYDDELEEGVF